MGHAPAPLVSDPNGRLQHNVSRHENGRKRSAQVKVVLRKFGVLSAPRQYLLAALPTLHQTSLCFSAPSARPANMRSLALLLSCSFALLLSLSRSFAPSLSRLVSLLFFRLLALPLSFFHSLALSLSCIFALKFRRPLPFALSPFCSLFFSLSRSCVLSLFRPFTLSFFRSLALPSLALSRSCPPALSFSRSF